MNLSLPFFNFLRGILMSTLEIVTSKKKIASEFRSYSSQVLSDVLYSLRIFSEI